MDLKIGTLIEGTVERWAFGGKGIFRTPNRFVIFVPFVIPGEKILCKITQIKKNYAEADLVEILTPHPERAIPRCPYFGECGGCQLQQANYPLQIKYKQLVVQEACRRVYPEAPISISEADPFWGYRRHISLTLRGGSKGIRWGYYGIDNTSIIPVNQCPIFESDRGKALLLAKNLIKKIEPPTDGFQGKLTLIKGEVNRYVFAFQMNLLPSNFIAVVEGDLDPTIQGVIVSTPRGQKEWGQLALKMEIGKFRFFYHPLAFLQNHERQSQNIYQKIIESVEERAPNTFLDLYCGIGITSVLAASHAKKVIGVEWNQRSIAFARRNALLNGKEDIKFISQDVEKILPELLKDSPEMVLVNPPRRGLSKRVGKELAESNVKFLLYLSCQPATLARDLSLFKECGFKLEKAQGFDMFPQTGHVESLIALSKG